MEDIFDRLDPEIQISFARSSGPGGQNVNKRSTKAILHWNPLLSVIPAFDKQMILQFFKEEHPSLITKEGVVVLQSDRSRSQDQNKHDTVKRLHDLIQEALTPKAKRISTNPTWSSISKHKASHKKHIQKKRSRQRIKLDEY